MHLRHRQPRERQHDQEEDRERRGGEEHRRDSLCRPNRGLTEAVERDVEQRVHVRPDARRVEHDADHGAVAAAHGHDQAAARAGRPARLDAVGAGRRRRASCCGSPTAWPASARPISSSGCGSRRSARRSGSAAPPAPARPGRARWRGSWTSSRPEGLAYVVEVMPESSCLGVRQRVEAGERPTAGVDCEGGGGVVARDEQCRPEQRLAKVRAAGHEALLRTARPASPPASRRAGPRGRRARSR